MAYQFVNASSAATTNSESSITIARPSGVQDGDLLILFIGTAASSASIAGMTSSDWGTEISFELITADVGRWFSKRVAASEPSSYVINFVDNEEPPGSVTAQVSAVLVAYRGLNSTQVGSEVGNGSGTLSEFDSPSVSGTAPVVLICFGAVDVAENVGTLAVPGSMTERAQAAGSAGIGQSRCIVGDEGYTSSSPTGVRTIDMQNTVATHYVVKSMLFAEPGSTKRLIGQVVM